MDEWQIAIKHESGPAEYSRYYFICSEVLYAHNEEIRIKLTFSGREVLNVIRTVLRFKLRARGCCF